MAWGTLERCNADERSTEEEMATVEGDPFERRVGRCVRPCTGLVGWLVGIAPTTVVGKRVAMNVHSDKT